MPAKLRHSLTLGLALSGWASILLLWWHGMLSGGGTLIYWTHFGPAEWITEGVFFHVIIVFILWAIVQWHVSP